MSDKDGHDQSSSSPSEEAPLWWRPGNEKLLRSRKATQIQLIVEAFDAAGTPVGIFPDGPPEDMEFLYRKNVVMTRDQDAVRVRRALEVDPDPASLPRKDGEDGTQDPIAGLHVISLTNARDDLRNDTISALDYLDSVLGVGVAVPDHVLHITNPNAGGCPATEPLPAAGRPDPLVSTDPEASGAGVLVSVVDTGLLAAVVVEHDWLDGVTGPEELNSVGHYRGHGTFIAGMVRAMAPQAQVRVEPFFYIRGAILESDLAPRLGVALDSMPDIISMSAGTTTRAGQPLLALEVFWEQRLSKTKGTVLVCAAGNDGNRGPFHPATMPWTVSVGALDVDGSRAGYSNFGSWVDVYACGSDVVNAYPKGVYYYQEDPLAGQAANFITGMASWSGTSFSTPLVSGLIAARMSWSGESARVAADVLLEMARENATPRVGAVLEPGMGCRPHSHCKHCRGGGHGGCGPDEHTACRCGRRTCC